MRRARKICDGLLAIAKVWVSGIWSDVAGPHAYKGLTVLIAGYVGLFAIMEWAVSSLKLCTCETCGVSDMYRVALQSADFRHARLRPASIWKEGVDPPAVCSRGFALPGRQVPR